MTSKTSVVAAPRVPRGEKSARQPTGRIFSKHSLDPIDNPAASELGQRDFQ